MKNKKVSKKIKGLLCVMMVGVVMVASTMEALALDFSQLVKLVCERKPEYEDSYAKLWYTMTWAGPNAVTESKYTYGSSTDAYVTYISKTNLK